MKNQILVGLFLVTAVFSIRGFCADLDNVQTVTVAASIQVINGSSALNLASASEDAKNSSLVNLNQASGLIAQVRFHNSTESDWFMQFLAQADKDVVMTLTKKGSSDMVDAYNVLASSLGAGGAQSMNVTIKVKSGPAVDRNGKPISGAVIACNANQTRTPSVSLSAAEIKKAGNMDAFTDVFRDKLEQQFYWFNEEGAHDKGNKGCKPVVNL